MRATPEVQVTPQTGVPFVRVGPREVWDLVEYLSWQRERVTYSHEDGEFVVRFPHRDPASAQQLLQRWAGSPDPITT